MKLFILLFLINNPKDTVRNSYHWYSKEDERMVGLHDIDTAYLRDTWLFVDGDKKVVLHKDDTLFVHHYPRH